MNHNRYIMTLLSLYETTIRTPAMYVASVMPHYQVILRHRSTLKIHLSIASRVSNHSSLCLSSSTGGTGSTHTLGPSYLAPDDVCNVTRITGNSESAGGREGKS